MNIIEKQSPITQYSFGFSVFLNWAALHPPWSDQNPDIVNDFPNMKREFLRTHLWRVPEGIWKVSSLQGRSSVSLSRVSDFLRPHGLEPTRLLYPWDSPGKNWSGLPCPPPGDLPDPGIEPASLMFPALEGGFFTTGVTWEASLYLLNHWLNHVSPQVCTSTPAYHRGFPDCCK